MSDKAKLQDAIAYIKERISYYKTELSDREEAIIGIDYLNKILEEDKIDNPKISNYIKDCCDLLFYHEDKMEEAKEKLEMFTLIAEILKEKADE